jgi:hypothetical protein
LMSLGGWYTFRSALAKRATGRRHECRRGTQECVRHNDFNILQGLAQN